MQRRAITKITRKNLAEDSIVKIGVPSKIKVDGDAYRQAGGQIVAQAAEVFRSGGSSGTFVADRIASGQVSRRTVCLSPKKDLSEHLFTI